MAGEATKTARPEGLQLPGQEPWGQGGFRRPPAAQGHRQTLCPSFSLPPPSAWVPRSTWGDGCLAAPGVAPRRGRGQTLRRSRCFSPGGRSMPGVPQAVPTRAPLIRAGRAPTYPSPGRRKWGPSLWKGQRLSFPDKARSPGKESRTDTQWEGSHRILHEPQLEAFVQLLRVKIRLRQSVQGRRQGR